jgi:hypothetical protein
MIVKLLRIQPARERQQITITEPLSYQTNVLRNRLWYRGDPSELEQFAMQTASDNVGRARFWAAIASEGARIRKVHSGLPALVADALAGIVVADLDGIGIKLQEVVDNWEAISKDNGFDQLLGDAIVDTLVAGDGAFKITIDTDVTEYPIIEFYSGEQVDYSRQRGRLHEVLFYTDYVHEKKDYRLEETFGFGYVKYRLLDKDGNVVPLTAIPETSKLADVTFSGDYIMAVPLRFFKSPKWSGRGRSLFDTKNDEFDSLDEVISQWWDAIRAGRVQKYIPEDLIPKNPDNGELQRPNPFDNQFVRLGSKFSEDADDKIQVVQPAIAYQAFVESYASALDMCLQGILSPSTLGIDLKKTDNAESQREKEKATLYTRGKLIEALNEVIPQLVSTVLQVYDEMQNKTPGEYEASVKFGEYASPSFDETIESVGKAKTFGIMSLETAVDQLYGDSWTDEQKAEEVARLKAEQAGPAFGDPAINQDAEPSGGAEDE